MSLVVPAQGKTPPERIILTCFLFLERTHASNLFVPNCLSPWHSCPTLACPVRHQQQRLTQLAPPVTKKLPSLAPRPTTILRRRHRPSKRSRASHTAPHLPKLREPIIPSISPATRSKTKISICSKPFFKVPRAEDSTWTESDACASSCEEPLLLHDRLGVRAAPKIRHIWNSKEHFALIEQ